MAYYLALPDLGAHAITRRQIVWCAAALIAFCGAVFLFQLGGLALFEPDEGRNAEIAREILVLNDWVTPHYDFVPYLDKPVFFYWLVALAFKVCGVSEWAARLPSMLAAIGCVVLVFDLGRVRGGVSGGLWSSLILATSPLFVAFARISIFDMTLTFFVTLALWAFARAARDGASGRGRWIIAMGAAMALATLTKGPIGVVLPALVVLVWAVWSNRWWFLRGSAPAVGVGIFVLLVVPWYLWAERRNPGYLRYFLLEENLLRYLTPRFRKEGPWYFYLVVLVLGTFPWSPLLYPLLRGIKAVLKDEQTRLTCIWAVVPLAFFSLSSSKLPGYLLPSIPPLALLLGGTVPPLFSAGANRRRWLIALPALSTLALVSFVLLASFQPAVVPWTLSSDSMDVLAGIRHQPWGGLALLLALPCLGVMVSLRARPWTCFVVACGTCAIVYGLMLDAAHPASERRSSRQLADQTGPLLRPDDQLAFYDAYFSSFPFYLRIDRPVWNVWLGRGDEIMGSPYVKQVRPMPALGVRDVVMDGAEFAREWNQGAGRLLVVVRADRVDRFVSQVGGTPRVLLRAGGAALITNR